MKLRFAFGVVPLLSALGFAVQVDYNAYIKSDTWRKKARRARKRAGNRCQDCGISGVRLEVHHKTYRRLGHERKNDLAVLCRACHLKRHLREAKHEKSTV